MREGFSPWFIQVLIAMPIMLIAVGPAFVLHEIGHKVVAKKNGCWAEFRADPKGLQFGMVLAFFLGILFMAPGAVMVAGLVTRRQNGHIGCFSLDHGCHEPYRYSNCNTIGVG